MVSAGKSYPYIMSVDRLYFASFAPPAHRRENERNAHNPGHARVSDDDGRWHIRCCTDELGDISF
jgi:hypothetical protein